MQHHHHHHQQQQQQQQQPAAAQMPGILKKATTCTDNLRATLAYIFLALLISRTGVYVGTVATL